MEELAGRSSRQRSCSFFSYFIPLALKLFLLSKATLTTWCSHILINYMNGILYPTAYHLLSLSTLVRIVLSWVRTVRCRFTSCSCRSKCMNDMKNKTQGAIVAVRDFSQKMQSGTKTTVTPTMYCPLPIFLEKLIRKQ